MYDPTIGRFLTEDPIGTADDVNEYRYVKNNPTDATDPTGLYEADNRYTKDTIKLVNVDDVLNRLVNLTIICALFTNGGCIQAARNIRITRRG